MGCNVETLVASPKDLVLLSLVKAGEIVEEDGCMDSRKLTLL